MIARHEFKDFWFFIRRQVLPLLAAALTAYRMNRYLRRRRAAPLVLDAAILKPPTACGNAA